MTLTAPKVSETRNGKREDGVVEPPFVTARNPYALAETVLGRPIDWSEVPDRKAFLEEVLQTPYEELFDPKHGSPVYLGYALDPHGKMREEQPKFTEGDDDLDVSDLDRHPAAGAGLHRLGDLGQLIGDSDLESVPVRSITPSRAGGYLVELGESPSRRLATLGRLFPAGALAQLINIHDLLDLGWTPPNGSWVDTGTFFNEAAEFFDPVQGGLGDCWLIAAMSSVAWALPYTIAQRSRATGTGNQQFTNQFRFVDTGTGNPVVFEATDETLVWSGTTSPMYGRSSEAGETWPALVEKAYAMWRGNTTNARPDLRVLNGGDPVHASAALTGRQPHYTGTSGTSAADLLQLVKANSQSYRTRNPMTAWTYGSGDDSPDKVDYGDANIVASHAYSVLGWARGSSLFRHVMQSETKLARATSAAAAVLGNDRVELIHHFPRHLFTEDYIILRNPWGFHEATAGEHTGTIPVRDVSFWRSIDLSEIDGVFAITASTFKRYFAGIGVAL